MSEQLKVTSPEEYGTLIEKSQDAGELVKLGSGMVVRAKRADMEGVALKGGLPMSLVAAAQGLQDGETEELTPEAVEEGQKALIFMRETTRKNALEPRIVYDESGEVVWEWPSGARREILTSDFKELSAWVMGREVDDLDSFRQPDRKERRTRVAKPGGKAFQPRPVGVAEGQSPTT